MDMPDVTMHSRDLGVVTVAGGRSAAVMRGPMSFKRYGTAGAVVATQLDSTERDDVLYRVAQGRECGELCRRRHSFVGPVRTLLVRSGPEKHHWVSVACLKRGWHISLQQKRIRGKKVG